MKGKYVTKEMQQMFYSQQNKKSIHVQLEETIAERKKVIKQYEQQLAGKPVAEQKVILTELAETIATVKKSMQQYWQLFKKQPGTAGKLIYMEPGNKAA